MNKTPFALTPQQELTIRLDRNTRDLQMVGPTCPTDLILSILVDSARNWVLAKEVDKNMGGNENERRAEANLKAMVKCCATRIP